MITAIAGGTLRQAAEWAGEHELQRREVRLITGRDAAEGLIFHRCVLVGTFWERRDALEVHLALERAGMKRSVEIEDLSNFHERRP